MVNHSKREKSIIWWWLLCCLIQLLAKNPSVCWEAASVPPQHFCDHGSTCAPKHWVSKYWQHPQQHWAGPLRPGWTCSPAFDTAPSYLRQVSEDHSYPPTAGTGCSHICLFFVFMRCDSSESSSSNLVKMAFLEPWKPQDPITSRFIFSD